MFHVGFLGKKSKMNFIQAIIEISKRKDLELCESEKERRGEHNICVYFNPDIPHYSGDFIGSLNWPYLKENGDVIPASVDDSVKVVLQEKLTEKQFNKRFKAVPFPTGKVSYKNFKKL